MNTQALILTLTFSALLSASAHAQSELQARRASGPAKNAGILHVGTGTWSRSASSLAALGPDTVYSNTASAGYFAILDTNIATGDFSIFDEGRLPGTDSPVILADRDDYLINGMTFSYCTDQLGQIGITFRLYESYNPCDIILTDPAGSSPFTLSGTAVAAGIPGGFGGSESCWVITLDLQGAGEFNVLAEGGDQAPGFEGQPSSDSFGIEWIFNGVAGTNTGPMIAGDPTWTPSVTGAIGVGGTGTYYDNTGTAPCGNTGLDTQDLFAVDGFLSPLAPGCYFFGGYQNPNGCGSPQANPFSSFEMTLFADAGGGGGSSETFCEPAGINSSGNAVSLSATPNGLGAGFRLDASGGPQLPGIGFGYFVVSSSTGAGVVIGDGTLCLNGVQGRYSPNAGGAQNSFGSFDPSGNFANLAGTSTTGFGFDLPVDLPSPPGGSITGNSTWHFQLWYRDMNPGATSNFSNGVSIDF